MSSGFIKIHRGLLQSKIWEKPASYLKTWVTILMAVQRESTEIEVSNNAYTKKYTIDPGELYVQKSELAQRVGVSVGTLLNALRYLEEENMIEVYQTVSANIYRVCNWDRYQDTKKSKPKSSQGDKKHDASPIKKQEGIIYIQNNKKQDPQEKEPVSPLDVETFYGSNGCCPLKASELTKLRKKYPDEDLKIAIEVFDGWVSTKLDGLKWFSKNHSRPFTYLNNKTNWVWKRVAEEKAANGSSDSLVSRMVGA